MIEKEINGIRFGACESELDRNWKEAAQDWKEIAHAYKEIIQEYKKLVFEEGEK